MDPSDPTALYVNSYLVIRTLVGVIGIVLPIAFIIGEAYFLNGSVHIRGSLSAYYHTSMRDLFVAGLSVIGILLATYMSGKTNTWDFWLSLVAGVAVIGVVIFPTARPGLPPSAPRCGTAPMPPGCSPIQQQLGEVQVASVHFVCAAIFIACLAAMSFVFAAREKKFQGSPAMVRFQRLCGSIIILAAAWAVVGGFFRLTVWQLTPLYLGEVISVWAFGASWLSKGKDLRKILRLGDS